MAGVRAVEYQKNVGQYIGLYIPHRSSNNRSETLWFDVEDDRFTILVDISAC